MILIRYSVPGIARNCKITQEVREFAARQNSNSFLVAEPVEGDLSAEASAKAETGMAEMSKKVQRERWEDSLAAQLMYKLGPS